MLTLDLIRVPSRVVQINVQFTSPGGGEMTAEIQIHLREIHMLKQADHFYYECVRAACVDDLR